MSEFIGQLDVRLVNDTFQGIWRLLAPIAFNSTTLGIMAGSGSGDETNFCSVPPIPLIYEKFGGRGRRTGAIHDRLYKDAELSRKVCDELLLEMLQHDGFSEAEAWLMYVAVRMCGEPHYGVKYKITEVSTTININS